MGTDLSVDIHHWFDQCRALCGGVSFLQNNGYSEWSVFDPGGEPRYLESMMGGNVFRIKRWLYVRMEDFWCV